MYYIYIYIRSLTLTPPYVRVFDFDKVISVFSCHCMVKTNGMHGFVYRNPNLCTYRIRQRQALVPRK